MARLKPPLLFGVVLLAVFVLGVGVAVAFNTDFGHLEVKTLMIIEEDERISGLMYRPAEATAENPAPGVVLIHGISGAKQVMSAIALELARHGYVALTIDAVGHGNSEGQLRASKDHSLGALAAVGFLKSLPFVKASSLGLVGHSLGAGAARAAAWAHGNIRSSVFIGGGFGTMVSDPAYGVVNSTFPENLLVVVGKFDIQFNLTQLEKETLPPVFGTYQKILPGHLYGDFSTQTARKLVVPATTHLFETVDSVVVSETVLWMTNAFDPEGTSQARPTTGNLTYAYRDTALTISLFAFVGLILGASLLISKLAPFRPHQDIVEMDHGTLGNWKALVIWGGFSLALYVPMSFAGLLLRFPPLIFGGGIAWWVLATAIVGLLFSVLLLPKVSRVNLKLRTVVSSSFDLRGINLGMVLYILAYVVVGFLEVVFAINLGIVAPFLKVLNWPWRILMFSSFIPFFLVYFFVEGLYLHEFRKRHLQSGLRSEATALVKTVGVKIIPFVAVLCFQYVPIVLLGVQVFPSFSGFLLEFFWLIAILFVISTICSWWFYRNTHTIGSGAIFNALLLAWISAAIFPF